MTKVLFLIEKDSENDVFAYFPELPYSVDEGKDGLFTCYAPIGQHSDCHNDYAKECKEADFNQYSDLLRELIGQGYKDLHILNSQQFEYHRKPTESELKFGEGSTHYRSFTLAQIGITKSGNLKKWVLADDGLRYYR